MFLRKSLKTLYLSHIPVKHPEPLTNNCCHDIFIALANDPLFKSQRNIPKLHMHTTAV